MICWYCHWGVSKPVAEIYKRAFRDLNGGVYEDGIEARAYWALNYGPAHCTWADENFERELVQSELDGFDEWVAGWNRDYDWRVKFTPEELAIVRRSLQELLALPDEQLNPEPQDYDGEHPEQYPPAVEMEHV